MARIEAIKGGRRICPSGIRISSLLLSDQRDQKSLIRGCPDITVAAIDQILLAPLIIYYLATTENQP